MALSDIIPDNVEYYTNAEQLLSESDIAETDVRILGWARKFRIRALTFGQMEKINRKSIILETNKEENRIAGEIDQVQWTILTITEGVIRPKFTSIQAKQLLEKNGEFVTELANEIWMLGRISKTAFDEYIEEQRKLNEARSQIKQKA